MRRSILGFLLAASFVALAAPPAAASSLGRVTEISGSAMVMRGNKVERLQVGSSIEKGDKIIVQGSGKVKLSSGAVIGPGTSSVSKGKSGAVDIVTTTSTASSTSYNAKSNTSKLFSKESGKSNKKDDDDKGSYGDRDDDDRGGRDDDDDRYDDRDDGDDRRGRGRGGRDDEDDVDDHDDDDDDDHDDDDDGEPHGYPDDHDPVSPY